MKITRYKRCQRYLSFYRNNFDFRPPYQIILDATFCQAALGNKINIAEQMPKYLNDQVKLLTTVCVVNETEKLSKFRSVPDLCPSANTEHFLQVVPFTVLC